MKITIVQQKRRFTTDSSNQEQVSHTAPKPPPLLHFPHSIPLSPLTMDAAVPHTIAIYHLGLQHVSPPFLPPSWSALADSRAQSEQQPFPHGEWGEEAYYIEWTSIPLTLNGCLLSLLHRRYGPPPPGVQASCLVVEGACC